MMRYVIIALMLGSLMGGCDNTDVQTAADAGMDALRAATLSDEEVLEIGRQAARQADGANRLAPPDNPYAQRLQKLTDAYLQEGNLPFTFGVYLSPEVNAFAMADGSIRLYSGIMDLMNDSDLTFVIGHEMGHVAKNHIRRKIQLAYAASAIRKGIASQNSAAGEIARSLIGDLAQSLAHAQFSQLEEKDADDYALAFLKREKVQPEHAVSALKKLATLGAGHSFLSSHPDPQKRAERLQAQVAGKAVSLEEYKDNLLIRARDSVESMVSWLQHSWIARILGALWG